MQKTVAEQSQDLLELSTLTRLDPNTHEPAAKLEILEEENILDAAAFETKPNLVNTEQSHSDQPNVDPDTNIDPKKEEKEKAEIRVRAFFERLKAGAEQALGNGNFIGTVVQKVCCAIEEVAVNVSNWFISNYDSNSKNETEVEVKEPNKDALELVGELLMASDEQSRDAAEDKRESAEKEKRKAEHDPMAEMLEEERRAEREKIDSPFYIEVLKPESAEASAIGSSHTEYLMEGNDLIERHYIEDAEGHLTIQDSRVRIEGPKPALKESFLF